MRLTVLSLPRSVARSFFSRIRWRTGGRSRTGTPSNRFRNCHCLSTGAQSLTTNLMFRLETLSVGTKLGNEGCYYKRYESNNCWSNKTFYQWNLQEFSNFLWVL